ncbi:hypothetical protein I4641_05980 [Waterburya agarophytonicola K14]|uniref:Uncharacterized protein n=1 Tax=Waterburya agarophytonicola KI4 TaxID=2874699 RepID=A0A964BPK9_9CYAN|nr:hypothetical protein [Waterburya agarophytonicola]MCC0176527.1 hypothetical protein [Waterburya agarophytonicola KI4]
MNYDLWENITAVEISTVIVEEIVDEMFIPWEAYQGIYYLSRSSLAQSNIDLSLRSHYWQLRRQLELTYCLLLIDPSSQLYNRTLVKEIKGDLPVLTRQDSEWSTLATRLPPPLPSSRHQTMSAVNKLIGDRSFLNTLQQLHQRKIALDRRDRIMTSSSIPNDITNSTYAQTSLQLDGKIINRYCQAILNRSDRNLLLQLHEQSTTAGEHQWRGMIRFMLSLVK